MKLGKINLWRNCMIIIYVIVYIKYYYYCQNIFNKRNNKYVIVSS